MIRQKRKIEDVDDEPLKSRIKVIKINDPVKF